MLVPAFREQDYDAGVETFVEIVTGIIRGEYEGVEKPYENATYTEEDRFNILLV